MIAMGRLGRFLNPVGINSGPPENNFPIRVTRCVIASVLSCSVLKLIHVQGGILYYISLMPLSIHLNGCGKPNLLNRIFPQWAFGQINKLPDSGR